jgi:hypothetical protein
MQVAPNGAEPGEPGEPWEPEGDEGDERPKPRFRGVGANLELDLPDSNSADGNQANEFFEEESEYEPSDVSAARSEGPGACAQLGGSAR